MKVLLENFDIWRVKPYHRRPKCWHTLTPRMVIDVVVNRLEHAVLEDTTISDYAVLVKNFMIGLDFDFEDIENNF